jgi:hypothetical protein
MFGGAGDCNGMMRLRLRQLRLSCLSHKDSNNLLGLFLEKQGETKLYALLYGFKFIINFNLCYKTYWLGAANK